MLFCLLGLLRRLFSWDKGEDDDEEEVACCFVAENVSKRVVAAVSASEDFL